MDDYIAKPVDPQELQEKLEYWLGKGEKGKVSSGEGGKGTGSSGKWQEEREATVPPLTLDTENSQARSQEPTTSNRHAFSTKQPWWSASWGMKRLLPSF